MSKVKILRGNSIECIWKSFSLAGYSLRDSSKNKEGFYVQILKAIESLLRYTNERHGRVFFYVRFEISN
jgi:hypothetical protein